MIKKLLVATHNPAKVEEYKKYLADLPLEIVSLGDLNITKKVKENGKTFKENAILKAETYGKLTGLPAITDDGGLEIDALGGEPGIRSRNWLGYRMTDEEMIGEVMKRMEGVPKNQRTCRLVGVIALFTPRDKIYTQYACKRGIISLKPCEKRVPGYPFRSIFFLPEFKKFYSQLTEEEHEQVNHRKFALEKLKKILKKGGDK